MTVDITLFVNGNRMYKELITFIVLILQQVHDAKFVEDMRIFWQILIIIYL